MTKTQSLWESNLSLLKSHHPAIWQQCKWEDIPAIGEIISSPLPGQPNLRVTSSNQKTILLHSPTPETEASSFLTKVPEHSTGVVILLGFGLGYAPLHILRHRHQIRNLVIYENNKGIFKQALANVDLSPLLMDPRVSIHLPPFPAIEQTLGSAAVGIQLEDTHFLKHTPSFTFDPSYHALSDNIYPIINKYNVGGATALQTGPTFLKNRIQNLGVIQHHYLLDELKDKFKNMPAVLVGGGPSLNKNLARLKNIGNNAIIIAVDSTLPALRANDITPHFVTTLDPDEVIYEKIADCAPTAKDTSLICMLQTATTIPKTFPAKHVFWGLGDSITEQWLGPFIGAKICTDDALTVANLSLAAAVTMGTNPIIFIGQDLAYTNFETHAAHTVLDNQDFLEDLKKKKDDLIWVKSIDGGQVPTDRGFFSAKNHFESMISKHPKTYINSTEGGAHIEGTTAKPFADTIEQYCTQNLQIKQQMESCVSNASPPRLNQFRSEAKKLIQQIGNTKSFIAKTKKINTATLKQVYNYQKKKKIYFTFQDLPASTQHALRDIDKLNTQTEQIHYIWRVLQDITLPGLKESERLRVQMVPLQSHPKTYLKWLTLHLKRFTIIDQSRYDALSFLETHLIGLLQFLDKEEELSEKISAQPENAMLSERLAEHYVQAGCYHLARPLTEKLLSNKESATINFYHGCVLMAQREYEAGTSFFKKARQLDEKISQKIENFLAEYGGLFLDYSTIYKTTDRSTSLNLLLKGLFFAPTHSKICDEIREYIQIDLTKINTAVEQETYGDAKRLVDLWTSLLEKKKILSTVLTHESQANLWYAHGRILAAEHNTSEARKSLSRTVELCPENAEYQIAAMSVNFAQGNFSEGIHHLQKAVSLKKHFASYWESIGDTLQEGGQHSDALNAYEQYLACLPVNHAIMKKIGNCYLALGQMEASLLAFQQAKLLAEQNSKQ